MHRFGSSVSREFIDRYLWPWEIHGHIFVSKKSYYSHQNMQWKASATLLASASFCEVWAKHLKFKDRMADASDGETSEANLALQYVLGKWCIMPSKAWVYTFTLRTILIFFFDSLDPCLESFIMTGEFSAIDNARNDQSRTGQGGQIELVAWDEGYLGPAAIQDALRCCVKVQILSRCEGCQSQLNVHRCAYS